MGTKSAKHRVPTWLKSAKALPPASSMATYSSKSDVWFIPIDQMKDAEQVFIVNASHQKNDYIVCVYDKRELAEFHAYLENSKQFDDKYNYSMTERSVLGLRYDLKTKKIEQQVRGIRTPHVFSSLAPLIGI
jgi:hypothetical protein